MEVLFVLNNLEETIKAHAIDEYPSECCGLLVGRTHGNVKCTIQVRKMSNHENKDNQGKNYLISPLEIIEIEKELLKNELEIVGIYHSHPECLAILSKKDETFMIPHLSYLIVSIYDNESNSEKEFGFKSYVKGESGGIREEIVVCK